MSLFYIMRYSLRGNSLSQSAHYADKSRVTLPPPQANYRPPETCKNAPQNKFYL